MLDDGDRDAQSGSKTLAVFERGRFEVAGSPKLNHRPLSQKDYGQDQSIALKCIAFRL